MKKSAFVFLCLFLSGCHNIVLEDDEYATIDGLWRVNIRMAENTCDPDEEFENFNTEMFVTVQDWTENGGYVADFFFAGAERRMVEIDANGNFVSDIEIGALIDKFSGNIIPGRYEAVFGLEIVDICNRMLDIQGYQPLAHNTPPDGFEE